MPFDASLWGRVKVVNFITATKSKDKKEFNGKRYIKIEADHLIK
jgi:hypothetical protein